MKPEEPLGYEPNQVDSHKVNRMVVLLLASIMLCLTGVAWLLKDFQQQAASQQPPLSALEREPLLPPAPRLQSQPREDGERQLTAERIHLNSFGWVDREKRIVHLPLEEAQKILLKQGWPTPEGARDEP